MTTPSPMSLDAMEQEVHACLTHLYDYAFLQNNALVHLLISDQTGPDRVQAFRKLILESIECLKPDTNVAFTSKAARAYNILSMRYVMQEQTSEAIKHLALSWRQFYRDHPKAVHNLTAILWERLTGSAIPRSADADGPQLSLQTEVQSLADQSKREWLDLPDLLADVISNIQPMAETFGVGLVLPATVTGLPKLEIDRTLLRQLLLIVLSSLVVEMGRGATIELTTEAKTGRQRVIFTLGHFSRDADLFLTTLYDQETLQLLVKTLKASFYFEPGAPDNIRVFFEFITGTQSILIIDDNPDAIDLFQRYLDKLPYHLVSAKNGPDGIQLAREIRPEAIILDIMLPGQDGLEVLQNLKHHKLTSHIPVLVCSILDIQALALSLGADDYLKKPPGQDELLSRLRRWEG